MFGLRFRLVSNQAALRLTWCRAFWHKNPTDAQLFAENQRRFA
jgi:hypothetical protein